MPSIPSDIITAPATRRRKRVKVPGSITVNDYLYGRDVEPRVVLTHSIRDLPVLTGTKSRGTSYGRRALTTAAARVK